MMFRILISSAVADMNRLKPVIRIADIPVVPYGVLRMRMGIVQYNMIGSMATEHIFIRNTGTLVSRSFIVRYARIDHIQDMLRSLSNSGVMVKLTHMLDPSHNDGADRELRRIRTRSSGRRAVMAVGMAYPRGVATVIVVIAVCGVTAEHPVAADRSLKVRPVVIVFIPTVHRTGEPGINPLCGGHPGQVRVLRRGNVSERLVCLAMVQIGVNARRLR
jgi:hypothetical protein